MILELFQKDYFKQKITVTENLLPINLSGYTFIFIVKAVNDTKINDSNALIKKQVVIPNNTYSQNGIFYIELTSGNDGDTDIDSGDYLYQIDLINTSEEKETLVQGKFIVKKTLVRG